MIRDFITGDITARSNKSDIIIGMNTALDDVTGIGFPFVKNSVPTRMLQLGSVISYDFDGTRKLHMIICHHLGEGGWEYADRYVRFGLDYLDHLDRDTQAGDGGRSYSIVRIGTGRIGTRDGADFQAIHRAMADSFLTVDLYLFKREQQSADVRAIRPLQPFRAWNSALGEENLVRLAA